MAEPHTPPSHPSAPCVAVVIGGGGFLGNALVGRLLEAGHEVRNLDFVANRQPHPRLSHWPGSFLEHGLVREALSGADTVYHLAATGFAREANANPARDAEENIVGTLNLLATAAEAGVARLVFCSSGGTVYGPTDAVPIVEDAPTNPVTAYGASKLACEKYMRLYDASSPAGIGNGRMRTVSLRVANPYGPGQNITKAQGALTTFCHLAQRGEPISIWGDGTVERDFVHVSDVARALDLAGRAGSSAWGTEINIGSGEGVSLNRLIALIAEAMGRAPEVRYSPGRGFDVPKNYLDISRAEALLGWRPQVALKDGIAELLRTLA